MFRILLADDHTLLLDTLTEYLQRVLPDGEVLRATSIQDVRSLLDSDPGIDLMIVDYFMPGCDGVTTMQELIQHPSRVPLAVMSGALDLRLVRELLHLGVVGYLPKTLSGMSLSLAIRLMMAGERYVPASLLSTSSPTSVPASLAAAAVGRPRIELSEREQQTLGHLRRGLTNKEIAREMQIEEATVKVYLARLSRAFGAKNRVMILCAALEQGYID